MATPPTFVAEYETVFSTSATPKTTSVTVAAGDTLVIIGMTEDQGYTLNTPTGGSLTYTLEQSVVVSNFCTAYVWTAPAPGSQTFTLSGTMTGGSGLWGFNCLRFSGSPGIGASSKTNITSGAPSLGITTTGDNSAIVVANADWTASDGASRTWRTVNGITPTSGNSLEVTYYRNSTTYTAYGAYWNDAGTAGAKTVGLSAPSAQKYSIVAVEVQGVTSSNVDVDAELVSNAHTTEQNAPSIGVADSTAPALAHQTFNATVTVTTSAEQTTHAVATGAATPGVGAPAGTTTHAQVTPDALAGVGATGGHPQTSHNAGDVTSTQTTTDGTAPATAHTTHPVGATSTTTDTTAPAAAHTTFDATVSTLAILNLDAPDTAHAVVTAGVTSTITTNAEHGQISHQAFDATAQTASNVNAPAEAALTTHQAHDAGYGLTPPAQSVTTDHQTSGVTALLTTTSGAATATLAAFDAIVTTSLAPLARYAVDAGSSWAGISEGDTTASTSDSDSVAGPLIG